MKNKMKMFFLSVFLLLNSFQQIRKLFRQKKKRVIYVYIGVMLVAAYLSVGLTLELYIPNPTNGIKKIFSPLQEWVSSSLE